MPPPMQANRSQQCTSPIKMIKSGARVLEVEKGSFTPLVFSRSGGMGGEAERLVKKLASKMEYQTRLLIYKQS